MMSDPRAVRMSGPLTVWVDGFCAELAGQASSGPDAGPAIPSPDDVFVGVYGRHLLADRGLAAKTVACYSRVARDVSARWGGREGLEGGRRVGGRVTALVVSECRQRSVPSAKAFVSALRRWLRFLYAQGVTTRELAGAVACVPSKHGRSWPTTTPSPQDSLTRRATTRNQTLCTPTIITRTTPKPQTQTLDSG